MFAERGINAATVEDICDAAGFTRGAFYSNFDSKQELLLALAGHERQRTLEALGRAIEAQERGAPFDQMLEQIVRLFVADQPMDREWALLQSEFNLHAIRNLHLAEALTHHRSDFLGQLGRLMQAGLERAGRQLTVDLADAVDIVVAICETGIGRELLAPPEQWGGLPGLTRLLVVTLAAISRPVDATP